MHICFLCKCATRELVGGGGGYFLPVVNNIARYAKLNIRAMDRKIKPVKSCERIN